MAGLPADFGKQLAEALKSGKVSLQVAAQTPSLGLANPIQSVATIFNSLINPLKRFGDILKVLGAAKLAGTPGAALPRFMGMGPQKFGPATPPTTGAMALGGLLSGGGMALKALALTSKFTAIVGGATAAVLAMTQGVISAARAFAEFSPALTALFAQQEVRQIQRSQQVGAQLAPFIGPLIDAFEDMKDAFMPLMVDALKFLTTILKPMIQLVIKFIVPFLQTMFDVFKVIFVGFLTLGWGILKIISAMVAVLNEILFVVSGGIAWAIGVTDFANNVVRGIDGIADGIDGVIRELQEKPNQGKDWIAPGVMMFDPHRPAFRKADRKVGPANP